MKNTFGMYLVRVSRLPKDRRAVPTRFVMILQRIEQWSTECKVHLISDTGGYSNMESLLREKR